MRTSRTLVMVLASGLLAGGLVACTRGTPGPDQTLNAFLDGWRGGSLNDIGFVNPAGQSVPATQVAAEIKSLSGELATKPPALRVNGKPKVEKELATAEISVSWPVATNVNWEYASSVQLSLNKDKKWQVVWAPTVIHPQLQPADALTLARQSAPRANIVDGAGQPIVMDRTVYHVGVEPGKVTDQAKLLAGLEAGFKAAGTTVSLADLPKRLSEARPTDFVEVVVLRDAPFAKARPILEPIDGVFFQKDTLPLAESRDFARALLGSSGEVTKEIMDSKPGAYEIGDVVGLSGLQRQYDDRLRGTPGLKVLAARKDAEGKTTSTELFNSAPTPGAPLKLSLNPTIQRAAEAAMAGGNRRAAIVAIKPSDGTVLAVANYDPAGGAVNLALEAQVAPGSTFKMVTAYGVLDNGSVTAGSTVPCPATVTVDGRVFKNAHDFSIPGTVPFHTDFARSCNTAFAPLYQKLGPNGLADAAKALGIGQPWDLGVPVFSGNVVPGGSAADQAAAAFGQGQTQVSPIALAAAVATVASGQFRQPKLLLDPPPAKPAADGPPLKASTVDPLRSMMREVVTVGTAKSMADVPGDVRGKTGTAEFDSSNAAKTHAWMIGYRGDLAFAVFVEDGGDSTATAVPLCEKFLRALPV